MFTLQPTKAAAPLGELYSVLFRTIIQVFLRLENLSFCSNVFDKDSFQLLTAEILAGFKTLKESVNLGQAETFLTKANCK